MNEETKKYRKYINKKKENGSEEQSRLKKEKKTPSHPY
jgi:hypothetical protein